MVNVYLIIERKTYQDLQSNYSDLEISETTKSIVYYGETKRHKKVLFILLKDLIEEFSMEKRTLERL